MAIYKLKLKNFRLFNDLELSLSPGINFLYGKNGSGKTSIIEAIYLCCSGRSFKSSNLKSTIKYHKDFFKINAYDNNNGFVLEINKSKALPINISINNKKANINSLIKSFPATVIDSSAFSFSSAQPSYRRKQLDKYVFLSDKSFGTPWSKYHQSLRQRNSALKLSRQNEAQIWNEHLITYGEKIHAKRLHFFNLVLTQFKDLLDKIDVNNRLKFLEILQIDYYGGFDQNKKLEKCLDESFKKDLTLKSTTVGPHKSDIKTNINQNEAKQILSRGEQKFLSILWCFSCHLVLLKNFNIQATLLIDDIRSELDNELFLSFIELLKNQKNQIIFSCIEDVFSSKIDSKFNNFKKFHVEHLNT